VSLQPFGVASIQRDRATRHQRTRDSIRVGDDGRVRPAAEAEVELVPDESRPRSARTASNSGSFGSAGIGEASSASSIAMACPPLVEARDFLEPPSPRSSLGAGAGSVGVVARRLAAGNRRLNAVGSVEAGHPSSVRASFGDNTPACRARYQLAQRASGSARGRSPGRARSTDRNRINTVFLIVMAIRSLSAIGIAWAPLVVAAQNSEMLRKPSDYSTAAIPSSA
jgi:hypothetical protein